MKRLAILITVLMLVFVLCGCNLTSGTFTMCNQQYADNAIKASYATYNGSMTKRIEFKATDQLTFTYQGDDGLRALILKDKDEVFEITDGSTFIIAEDDTYDIVVTGEASDGQFELSWDVTSK